MRWWIITYYYFGDKDGNTRTTWYV